MKRAAPLPPGPAPDRDIPPGRRLSGTGPRASRPTAKPPPPPKLAPLNMTAAEVHPRPQSPSSPYYNVPPPYSTNPPKPTRMAPEPPVSKNGQLPPQNNASELPPEPEVISPTVAPSVGAAVRRPPSYTNAKYYPASPDEERPQNLPRGEKNRPEDIEMDYVGDRTDPNATQTASLLRSTPTKKAYDPDELPPPDYFVLSLVTCLCCCLPIGLLAVIFSICSSNASGVGKTKRGRRLGNVALILSILGCVAAISTALALYFTGTGEELFYKIKDLIVNGTSASMEDQGTIKKDGNNYGSNYGSNYGNYDYSYGKEQPNSRYDYNY